MKKYLWIVIAILLTACADKNQYQEAVLAQMEKEKDLKDYHIAPEYMVDCVVDLSSHKMPGFFDLDPERMTAYRNYAKMLTLMQAADPKKAMEELRKDFGSPKALADAHANYTESLLDCYTTIVSKSEDEQRGKDNESDKSEDDDGQMDDDGEVMDEDSFDDGSDMLEDEGSDGSGSDAQRTGK